MQTFESSITKLAEAVHRLEERVAALERGERRTIAAEAPAAPATVRPLPLEDQDRESQIALLGRTVLILGGAYLLRAITDTSVVPRPVGVGLGVIYALVWFAAADRSALRGSGLSATMHALAGVLIAFPLLFEGTHRFKVLPAGAGAMLLATVAGFGLFVAARRSLRAMAWLVTLGGLLGGVLMLLSTKAALPFGIFFIALGVATVWASYVLDWFGLRWIPAAVADGVVLVLTLAHGEKGSIESGQVLMLQLLLFVAYGATFAIRTLARGREALPFEIAQMIAALVIGVGGAGLLSDLVPSVHLMLGVGLVALGLAAYAVAFAFVERRGGSNTNFFFYSTVAFVVTFYGTALVFPGAARAFSWGAIGVAAAVLADRFGKVTLAAHAAIYLGGATFESGALGSSVAALASPAGTKWRPFAWYAYLIVALLAVTGWLVGKRAREFEVRAAVPRLVLFSLFVLGGAGVLLHAVISEGVHAAALAACRTGVLSVTAVALAAAAHQPRLAPARLLVYPVLILTAVKLALEDLRMGTPLMLFIALGLYGAALIVAPRLRPKGR